MYAIVLTVGTLVVQGRSMLEWVHLLIPPGKIRESLVYLLQHHHPVTFHRLLRFADVLVNMLLFFPLGLAIYWTFSQAFAKRIRKLLLLSLLVGLSLSIGIELLQFLAPSRVSGVSDVIANTGGAVFGCYSPYFWKHWKLLCPS